MSSALAATLAMLVYAIALLPILWLALGHRPTSVAAGYTAFLLIVVVYNTGAFRGSSLASTDVSLPAGALVDDTQCRQALDLAQNAGLALDRTDPDSPAITGPGSEQLPPEVRDVLIDCFERQSIGANPDSLGSEAR